jgi:mRNA m6A methyltransferase non-catalytic subunit
MLVCLVFHYFTFTKIKSPISKRLDTDVILWEGDPTDPTRKPPEMYQLIENFCLGTRRLELFGRYHSLRRGWVCVTAEELKLSPAEAREKDNAIPFGREKWEEQLKELSAGGKSLVPNTQGLWMSLRSQIPLLTNIFP